MVQVLVELVEISPVEMLVALNAAIVPFCQFGRISEKDAVCREVHQWLLPYALLFVLLNSP